MEKHNYICLFLLLGILNVSAAQQLTIIPLKYRQADELVDTIKPFLGAGETVTSRGYDIYLNAHPDTTQNIRALIARMDKEPAQLLISINNGNISSGNRAGYSIDGSLHKNNVQIGLGDRAVQNDISLHASEQTRYSSESSFPSIRATEGQPALIYGGSILPVKTIQRGISNGRRIERETYNYRPVQSGLYVTARLSGENVILEIEQRHDSAQTTGAISVSGLNTTAQGKLGEWIELGGVETATRHDSSGISGRSAQTNIAGNTVSIKVERIN
jgi:type II secretory pathway component GspD/PulD (secretin)